MLHCLTDSRSKAKGNITVFVDKLRGADASGFQKPCQQRRFCRHDRGFTVGNGSFIYGGIHFRFVAVNVLCCQPFRFLRKKVVQFPHFGDLLFNAAALG